jgi:hydroxypyruvate isomerase
MDRRAFLTTSLAGTGAAVSLAAAAAKARGEAPSNRAKFRMKYAPHFGMFSASAGKDPIDQIKFAADQGFTAWEDNGMMGKPPDLQKKIGDTFEKLGMTMGVFVTGLAGGTDMVTRTDKDLHETIRKNVARAIETAKRCRATWTTVVPGGVNQRLEEDYQTANCIENLKVAAEACEPAGLVMVLEILNWWANHPGLFLRKMPQAYLICKAVGSPSCKILDDLYHAQIQEGNLIPNMEKSWDEIGYIQVGDNPGRKEPTTGEINYKNVFKWLHDKGYEGVIGMEHGKSKGGEEGEKALIEAYRYCDNF